MSTEISNTEPAAEAPGFRSIDEVASMYGVSMWTVRLWVDRFGTLEHVGFNGCMRFPPRTVEQIGTICRMTKKGMTVADVRGVLESRDGDNKTAIPGPSDEP